MRVLSFNWTDLDPTDRAAAEDWVRSFGVDPADAATRFVVAEEGAGWKLHLTEYMRNEQGQRYVSELTGGPAYCAYTIAVDPAAWPEFVDRATLQGAAA